MKDEQANLSGFHNEAATVRLTLTPDGSYPSFQFIEFRTPEAAKQYVSVVNGKCDDDGEVGYKAEIVGTVTIRRADNLGSELRYLKLSNDDYDDARLKLGDIVPARRGMPGYTFHVGQHRVEQLAKNKYGIYASNGLYYELVPVGEREVAGENHVVYHLIHPTGEVDWEETWPAGDVPKGLLKRVGTYEKGFKPWKAASEQG